MSDSARWTWARLGDPASLSPVVALIYLPFGLIGPLLIDRGRIGGTAADWLMVGLAGQLALMAWLALAKGLVHWRDSRSSRPLLTVLALVIAAIARGAVMASIAAVMHLTPTAEFEYRLGAGITTQAGVLAVVAILVSSYVFHHELAAELAEQQARLELINQSMQSRLDETRAIVAMQVRQLVDPLIEQLDAIAQRSEQGVGVVGVTADIRQLVDDQLRPLSHQLVSSTDSSTWMQGDLAPDERRGIPLPKRLVFASALRPLGLGLLTVLVASSQSIRDLSGANVAVFPLVSGLLVAIFLAALRFVAGSWSLPLWPGVAVVALALAAIFVVTLVLEQWIGLAVPSISVSLVAIGGAILGLMVASYVAITDRRIATQEQLRLSVDELRTAASVLRRNVFLARRQLGQAIHGSLQSALTSASMRLAVNPDPSPDLVAAIRRDVADATARLENGEAPSQLLVQTLGELSDLWSGTCDVRWTMSHQTVRRLAESSAASASVAEIARECTSNAIRHGRATRVVMSIDGTADNVIVTCQDNGVGLDPTKPFGLGSHMLDEMCLEWRRTSNEHGTCVLATLPLQQDVPSLGV